MAARSPPCGCRSAEHLRGPYVCTRLPGRRVGPEHQGGPVVPHRPYRVPALDGGSEPEVQPEILRVPRQRPLQQSDGVRAGSLKASGQMNAQSIDAMQAEIAAEVERAFDAADAAPFPDARDAYRGVYAGA